MLKQVDYWKSNEQLMSIVHRPVLIMALRLLMILVKKEVKEKEKLKRTCVKRLLCRLNDVVARINK